MEKVLLWDCAAGDIGAALPSTPSLGCLGCDFLHRGAWENFGQKTPIFPIPQADVPYGGCLKAPPIYGGIEMGVNGEKAEVLPN